MYFNNFDIRIMLRQIADTKLVQLQICGASGNNSQQMHPTSGIGQFPHPPLWIPCHQTIVELPQIMAVERTRRRVDGAHEEVRGILSSNGTKTAMEKDGRPRHGDVGYAAADV